jgi:LDH2 family malate/lactate/ureidoglycolate dehydrogenase
VSAALLSRYRLDDLRRFAAALLRASGLAPARALALASHLLWFDAAGAPCFGTASLPYWLEAIAAGRFDPGALGTVTSERAAFAILDGQNGLPSLILERAGELAVQKARDTAVGMVRVLDAGELHSAAAVTAAMSLGPVAAFVLGPSGTWSVALPSAEGSVILDAGLGGDVSGRALAPGDGSGSTSELAFSVPPRLDGWLGVSAVFAPRRSWLVAALTIPALEPLSIFHQRVAYLLHGPTEDPCRLVPAVWNRRRREAYEHGIALPEIASRQLEDWARRLAVALPNRE